MKARNSRKNVLNEQKKTGFQTIQQQRAKRMGLDKRNIKYICDLLNIRQNFGPIIDRNERYHMKIW